MNQIRELIHLKNNPAKKTHQLDQLPNLIYFRHKNNGADTAQSTVTVQDGTSAETFIFGLYPYV